MAERQFDLLIVGAGLVGAAAACLLARAGFSVAVLEAKEPAAFDQTQAVGLRVSAFSPGSAAILGEAGAWRNVEQSRHCAYRQMIVEDRDESVMLEFNAAEFAMERLGTIVENECVQWFLWQSLQASGGVELICPDTLESVSNNDQGASVLLKSGRRISCRLLVGADGAGSAVRKALGVGQRHWEYGQLGIVSVIHCSKSNPGIAWQRFKDGGPLAFLPLQDGGSSIVWSRPQADAHRLLDLDESEFATDSVRISVNLLYGDMFNRRWKRQFDIALHRPTRATIVDRAGAKFVRLLTNPKKLGKMSLDTVGTTRQGHGRQSRRSVSKSVLF